MENSIIKCPVCGADCEAGARLCASCGATLPEAQKETKSFGEKMKSMKDRALATAGKVKVPDAVKTNKNLLKDGAILLLALLLFIFSFLPVLRYDIELELGDIEDKVKLGITPFDNIGFFFDSMMKLDSGDLEDSRLYERYEDKMEIVSDIDLDEDRLTGKERRAISDMLKLTVKATLRSEDVGVTFSLFVNALISLAYFLFALGFLLAAAYNFTAPMRGKEQILPLITKLLCGFPFVAILTHITVKVLWTTEAFGASALGTDEIDSKMGGAGAILFFSLVAVLGICAYRIYLNRKSINLKALATKCLTVVLAVVTVLMITAPALGAKIETEFAGKSRKQEVKLALDAYAFLELELTEDRLENIEDYLGKEKEHEERLGYKLASFGLYTKKQAENGEMDATVCEALLYSYISAGGAMRFLVARAPYLMVAAAAMAAYVAFTVLAHIATGEKRSVKIAFIVMAAAYALSLLCAIIYIGSINGNLKDLDLDDVLKARIGASYILFPIFAALTYLVPVAAGKLGIKEDEFISVAPVVEASAELYREEKAEAEVQTAEATDEQADAPEAEAEEAETPEATDEVTDALVAEADATETEADTHEEERPSDVTFNDSEDVDADDIDDGIGEDADSKETTNKDSSDEDSSEEDEVF